MADGDRNDTQAVVDLDHWPSNANVQWLPVNLDTAVSSFSPQVREVLFADREIHIHHIAEIHTGIVAEPGSEATDPSLELQFGVIKKQETNADFIGGTNTLALETQQGAGNIEPQTFTLLSPDGSTAPYAIRLDPGDRLVARFTGDSTTTLLVQVLVRYVDGNPGF